MEQLPDKLLKIETAAGVLVNQAREAYAAVCRSDDVFAKLYLLELVSETALLETKIKQMADAFSESKAYKN